MDENTNDNDNNRRRPGRGARPRLPADHVFDYKDVASLRYFVTNRGKIIPRRTSGLSAKQQRNLVRAIKRARVLALLPFAK